MAHYSREEWKAFAEETLRDERSKTMEKHLLTCNRCLQLYLSCFPESSAAGDALELHPLFTSRVMQRVEGLDAGRKGRSKRQETIFYYAAAACLTLFFMFAGVFEGFVGALPEIKADLKSVILAAQPAGLYNQGLTEPGWSDKLLDSTLALINTIKLKDEEGFR